MTGTDLGKQAALRSSYPGHIWTTLYLNKYHEIILVLLCKYFHNL
jgi:hypothetical protein